MTGSLLGLIKPLIVKSLLHRKIETNTKDKTLTTLQNAYAEALD